MRIQCYFLAILLALWTQRCLGESSARFPRPFLHVDKSARVVKMECEPPDTAKHWDSIYDLRIFGFIPSRSHTENQTIAVMTSAMKTPDDRSRGKMLPSLAKVTFTGNWEVKEPPALTVEMPFTVQDSGTYYCTVEYSLKADTKPRHYSVGIEVSERKTIPLTEDNFQVWVKKTHFVTVTWKPPPDTHFLEGKVSMIQTDKKAKSTMPPQSLFIAAPTPTPNKLNTFEHSEIGVLLSELKLHPNTGQNCSMFVYVDGSKCVPFCKYDCFVSYPVCAREDASFCQCVHEDSVSSNFSSVCPTYESKAVIVLGVSLLVCICVFIALVILLRKGKCVNFRNWLLPITENPGESPPRGTTTPTYAEGTESQTIHAASDNKGSYYSAPSDDTSQGKQVTLIGLNTRGEDDRNINQAVAESTAQAGHTPDQPLPNSQTQPESSAMSSTVPRSEEINQAHQPPATPRVQSFPGQSEEEGPPPPPPQAPADQEGRAAALGPPPPFSQGATNENGDKDINSDNNMMMRRKFEAVNKSQRYMNHLIIP